MTVLCLTNCPTSLRGDLTKWLMEIATGVYVGRVSARVRDGLWVRVVESAKGGRAVMVFNANNEQRMDFRVHGETWEPIDFDGLKLMLRPNPARLAANRINQADNKRLGFSNAAKFHRAKKFSKARKNTDVNVPNKPETLKTGALNSYVVIDIETTGVDSATSEITEIGAVKTAAGEIVATFQSFVRIGKPIPHAITKMTGITDEILKNEGRPLIDVMKSFLKFVENLPLVAHNMPFDLSFLNKALDKCKLDRLTNETIDTLTLAKSLHKNIKDYKKGYKLKNLALHYNLKFENAEHGDLQPHRSLSDCRMTHLLYQKLMKLQQAGL